MSRFFLFTTLAMSLMVTSCGGSNDSAAIAEHADDVSASVTQAKPLAAQPSATQPAKKSDVSRTGPEIAGLYLDMTPEEARAAMEAYDPSMQIQDTSRYFEYNALGKRYKTNSFLVATHGQMQGGRGGLAVGYSYPPGEPRVVSVTRSHRQTTEPLTQADYLEALIDKYGQPVEDIDNGRTDSQAERTLKWKLPGTGDTSCVNGASVGNSVLDRFVKDGRKMADLDVTLDYAAQCAGLFEYTLRGDPVTNASGTIFDVWAQARSEFEARVWVQQQVEEKSKTGTAAPKL